MKPATTNHLLSFALMTMLTGALATGCSSEELTNAESEKKPITGTQITINASLPQADTRMEYTEENSALKTVWKTGDAFQITSDPDDEDQAMEFTLKTEDDGKALGKFTGTAPAEASTYTIFYPKSIKTMDDFLWFYYDTDEQTQVGDNTMDHLTEFHSMMKTTSDYKNFSFSNTGTTGTPDFIQSSVMKFVLSGFPKQITPNRITLGCIPERFFADNDADYATTTNSLCVNLQDITNTQAFTAYMAMSALAVTLEVGDKVNVTVQCGDFYYYKEILITQETILESGKLHTITIDKDWIEMTDLTKYTVSTDMHWNWVEPLDKDGQKTKSTADNPRIIDTAAKFAWLKGHAHEQPFYKLTVDIDIDMTGSNWTDGSLSACTFDGNGHTISGLYINDPDGSNTALFSSIHNSTLKYLTVEGYVKGSGNVAGIVANTSAGSNPCYIIGCHNACTVEGKFNTAGIANITVSAPNSAIVGCYNTGTINRYAYNPAGSTYLGGIVGSTTQSTHYIIGCYNAGAISSVTTTEHCASIVGAIGGRGDNNSEIKNCLYTTDFDIITALLSGMSVTRENNEKVTPDELNSTDPTKGFAALNAGIKAWNAANPGKECNYHYEAGATNPVIVAGAPQ